MKAAVLILAAAITSSDPLPPSPLDPLCETAAEAIETAKEEPNFLDAKEVFGSKAMLLHALFSDETSKDFSPSHALLIAWVDGWGSVLFCKAGDWYGSTIDPAQWRHAIAIASEIKKRGRPK